MTPCVWWSRAVLPPPEQSVDHALAGVHRELVSILKEIRVISDKARLSEMV